MFRYLSIISLFFAVNHVLCGVLIISPKQLQMPSLKPFDESSYDLLREAFKKSKIVSFRIDSDKIPVDCNSLLDGKFSAYVPNIDYIPEDTISKYFLYTFMYVYIYIIYVINCSN